MRGRQPALRGIPGPAMGRGVSGGQADRGGHRARRGRRVV